MLSLISINDASPPIVHVTARLNLLYCAKTCCCKIKLIKLFKADYNSQGPGFYSTHNCEGSTNIFN